MSVAHTERTRDKMKKDSDKKTYMVYFYEGDLVYLFIPRIIVKETKRKLAPLWHGPFTLVKLTTPYTAILRRHYDGKTLKRSVHISRLKKAGIRDLVDFHKHVVYRESELPCTLTMCVKETPLGRPPGHHQSASKARKISNKKGKQVNKRPKPQNKD